MRPLKILLADDIDDSRNSLCELLKSQGCQCITASSGQEVLELVATEQPDLIFLDLLMPNMDGFEVIQILRKQVTDRWLPVIVTSSLGGDNHFSLALKKGADDYLVRPINPDLLEAKLDHYERILTLQANNHSIALQNHAIFDNIADAVLTFDAEGRIINFNRSASELIGSELTLEQTSFHLLGKSLSELMSCKEIEIELAGYLAVFGIEAREWGLDGQFYATVVLHNLTEQREIMRMKEEFVATVSHELRTPLTSIVGALGLLNADIGGPFSAEAKTLLNLALRNGKRLSHLIDDVLDLTKLEGNQISLQIKRTSLNELLVESIEQINGYADSYGVTLSFHAAAEKAEVLVDYARMLQVMDNLISNAIKHSQKDSEVEIVLTGETTAWRIDVIDRGYGIDPAFRDQLFKKFTQADASDARKLGGTGLGLYISRMLVERMGGQISVQSVLGFGSTFSVKFPVNHQNKDWLLCISLDKKQFDRLQTWLSPMIDVHWVMDYPGALELLARLGPPRIILADPQGQGQAIQFCQQVLALGSAQSILLIGDSIDEGFAQSQGLAWSGSKPAQFRAYLQKFVQQQISGQPQ